MDKPLLASLVTLGAAVLAASGVVSVSDAEQQALIENLSVAVGAFAAVVASLRGIYLRAKTQSGS